MTYKFNAIAIAVALSVPLTACNSSDNNKNTNLPILGEAEPATLELCDELITEFDFNDTTITSAVKVEAGEVSGFTAPEHCVITGEMESRLGNGLQGSTEQPYAIKFEMRLPIDWTGRYYYQANGGLDGRVNAAVGTFLRFVHKDESALNHGFAVISSDAGHEGYGQQYFGLDNQARLNYGYQAVEKLTPMAKSLIEKAYGKAPDRSYFGGCSNGGRHTMVAASRLPEQYDGYLVANPGLDLPQAAITQLYGVQQFATLIPDGTAMDSAAAIKSAVEATVTPAEYMLIANTVTKLCDALDGAADGMVNNIVGCQMAFDIQRDVPSCVGERDGTCLTDEQKTALDNIMQGPQKSDGTALYAQFPYDIGIGYDGWISWEMVNAFSRDAGTVATVFSVPPTEFDDYNVYGDPGLIEAYQYSINLDMDEANFAINHTTNEFNESAMQFMGLNGEVAFDTLRERGAKMIVVHGSSDPVFSVQHTIDWYQNVDEANGGKADSFAKLFLVPGMNHCGQGPATDQVNFILEDIIAWVERGEAPEKVIANTRAENLDLPNNWAKDRSRPLCPFPEIATYNGTGDMEKAESFTCIKP
ncbi:tannase/feruloyl esterase family alpha/beta hydrolase [Shewanella waksmanii]|uniref:tannase/feruloyl esterase family alpha/beta hydrolase n=1 Tax=Shewanella waksmanii TaxID=213783 RepID=UPI00049170A1|nr:tannase/feruloyl esterase family alpha/beta hydrolase [Shewanella waksmanii]